MLLTMPWPASSSKWARKSSHVRISYGRMPLIGNAPTTLLRELQKPETSPCQHGELADSAMNSGARCVSQAHRRIASSGVPAPMCTCMPNTVNSLARYPNLRSDAK